MNNDPMLDMFIFETMQLTERLEEVLIEGEQLGALNLEHINEIFRIMHTIKGSAAMMGFTHISTLGHSVEDMFFHIREHDDAQPDWTLLTDLCLESADFFKQETAKIQAGLPSDGDETPFLTRIEALMDSLTGAAPDDDGAADQPASAEKPTAAPASQALAMDTDLPIYRAHIFFEEGCKMENIRAFQIVGALHDHVAFIETSPSDLLEDCSDEIVNNGVTIRLATALSFEKIHTIISQALFVQSFDLAVEEPAGPSNKENTSVEPNNHKQESAPQEAPQGISQGVQGAQGVPQEASQEAAKQPPGQQPKGAAPAKAAPVPIEAKQSFISVNVDKLDRLMDLVGELVISVSMVVNSPDLQGQQLDSFEKAAALLTKNTGELQDVIMSVRMIPVSSTFHKMNRIVRDLSHKLGKEVELTILGEETEVDKNIIDNLSDPLMHIIRNSMDHGLEDARDDRLAAGKPPVGKIVLEARNSGSDVIISCTDDGRGLDRGKIWKKAELQGLVTKPESEYSDRDVYNFIMLPGFSTNDQVTEVSGRGVGMDVVKKNIEKIGGNVLLDSTPGQGMTVTIRIPLTLAILAGIEIRVGSNFYIVPTLNIKESFKPRQSDIIVDPDGREMILFRGECLPIVRLHRLFRVHTECKGLSDGIMIMVEDERQMVGVFADDLIGEQQIVVKPIPPFITKRIGQICGVSGCTILGNGNISLIIDVKNLIA